MHLPVLKITQSGKTLYLGAMRAADMLNCCVIDTWDPAKLNDIPHQGYQREVNEAHVGRIADWLKKDKEPFMPNGALLSAREDEYGILPFEATDGDGPGTFGHLTIAEGRQLFIVDYQHRWQGLKRAIDEGGRNDLRDHVIPITIMSNATRYDEMIQFYLINSKQKRIDTDLALALVQTLGGDTEMDQLVNLVGREKKFRIRATRLTFKIAIGTKGPWASRIKLPHDIPQPDAVLSMKSFADSLALIVSSRSPICDLADEKIIDILNAYWTAISQLMPAAFQNPREYSIQKTPGVFSMHIVAAKTVLTLCKAKSDFSVPTMKGYLAVANWALAQDNDRYMELDFWRSRGPVKQYGGSGGHRSLATLIRNKIESKHPVAK